MAKGWKMTIEQKKRLSDTHKGYVMPQFQKDKIGKSLKGTVFTEERKANISKALTGKVVPTNVREKISKTLIGRKNSKHSEFMKDKKYAYIQDRSKLKLREGVRWSWTYYNWLTAIRKRDNFKCKISNEDCCDTIEVHHILRWKDYPELRYDINNGITLCSKHHPKGKEKEIRMSSYLKDLLKNNL